MPAHVLLSATTLVAILLTFPLSVAQARPPVTSLLELRQQRVTMQEWDLSCGAAALATLLQYQLGLDITEREIAVQMAGREKYRQRPDLLRHQQGFSLLDLKRFVESRGLTGRGMGQLSLHDLTELAPILVPISFLGYNHFVVFRGMVGNRVLLADPAWGNRTVLQDQFVDAWIEFADIGRVGFEVSNPHKGTRVNQLRPTEMDFVMLQ